MEEKHSHGPLSWVSDFLLWCPWLCASGRFDGQLRGRLPGMAGPLGSSPSPWAVWRQEWEPSPVNSGERWPHGDYRKQRWCGGEHRGLSLVGLHRDLQVISVMGSLSSCRKLPIPSWECGSYLSKIIFFHLLENSYSEPAEVSGKYSTKMRKVKKRAPFVLDCMLGLHFLASKKV